ncbi:MAG: DNA topoisomerase IV subunit A [Verrucomicrobiales bacterium]|nr:DNA topoisomerase IV subunit A [Verrucomicrobiales bacterium]
MSSPADPAPGDASPSPAQHPHGTAHKPVHPLHRRMDRSFLEYASYVIRDRAIPNLADGLKPVQRRILWAMHRMDDGKLHKVANVVGQTMPYHPHGDASIGDAIVVLANKRYLIEGQGNFGNILTGDPAAAARYIEARLSDLARTELFNDELTEFVPTYDGRNKEPVVLPCKLPLLLMLGTEGIAVGLSARILPHNFCELLEAQIAILENRPFKVLPDFPGGGHMDAKEYADGKGSVRVRAKVRIKDDDTVLITEIPPGTTTESLIGSIEDAAKKGRLKVRAINDFTSEKVEIAVEVPKGVNARQLVDALFAFTQCEQSITSRIVVIRDQRPVEMTVSEVLQANTEQLVVLLRRELELKKGHLELELHHKTLVQLFIEKRIYQRLESAKTAEAVVREVYEGFKPLRKQMLRDLTDEDVEMLLRVPIRRISLFDLQQHRDDMEKIGAELAQTLKHLKNVKGYTIARLKGLLEKHGVNFPRLTRAGRFDEVEAKDVAFKSFKFTYDRESGYVGSKAGGDEFTIMCSQFDKMLLVFKDGRYKVIELSEKLFVGQDLIFAGAPDRDRVFTVAYSTKEATWMKRITFGGTILNKEYQLCPEPKSKILLFEPDTPEQVYIRYKPAPYQRVTQQTAKPSELALKPAKARGNQVSIKDVASITSKPPRGWDAQEGTTALKFL